MAIPSRTLAVVMGFMGATEALRTRKGASSRSCGTKGTLNVSTSIVNGDDADECEWPWQVGLWSPGYNKPWCGGTLIDPEWVLTAAHCIDGQPFTVRAGDWKPLTISRYQQERARAYSVKHPLYVDPTKSHDYALVKLSSPFELNKCVDVACLPESPIVDGSTCWITGWGTLASGGNQPDILQEAAVSIISNTDCTTDFYYDSWQIDESMICAQGKAAGGNVDGCQGDSGGPLVCESGGQWVLQGATSWGRGCALNAYPGVYARVTKELDWIAATMDAPAPEPPKNFICNGCDIDDKFINDNYCDCDDCSDEVDHNCTSCLSGCPSIDQCKKGQYRYCLRKE